MSRYLGVHRGQILSAAVAYGDGLPAVVGTERNRSVLVTKFNLRPGQLVAMAPKFDGGQGKIPIIVEPPVHQLFFRI